MSHSLYKTTRACVGWQLNVAQYLPVFRSRTHSFHENPSELYPILERAKTSVLEHVQFYAIAGVVNVSPPSVVISQWTFKGLPLFAGSIQYSPSPLEAPKSRISLQDRAGSWECQPRAADVKRNIMSTIWGQMLRTRLSTEQIKFKLINFCQ